MPYERFVMVLKSRSHTHHMYLLLLHSEYAKTCLPSRSTQKCSTPTLGVNTKKYPIGFPSNKCSKFLLLSLKSFLAKKRHVAMQKLKKRRKKERVLKKNGQVSKLSKQWVLGCSPEKNREKRDSPCCPAKLFPSSKKRGMFQGAK
jgi:hypothetical protein